MGESIIKRGTRGEYTVIQNSALRDPRLSLKTKGLFAVMISLPDDWEYSISGLASFVGVGRDAIRTSLQELKLAGYLLQEQAHDENGKFACSVYVLQEIAPPLSGFPSTVKPTTDYPTQTKERYNKIPPIVPQEGEGASKKTTTTAAKWKPERFEKFWAFFPKGNSGKGSKQRAAAAWDKLKPDDHLLGEIAKALEKQKATEMWSRGVGIPYASTYLNGRRWEDAKEIGTEKAEEPKHRYLGTRVIDGQEVDVYG